MTPTRTVLIVDDEPNIRGFLKMALEDEGFSVESAANGKEALDKVRRRPPDAVLLDLLMPVMDGWGFLAAHRTLAAQYRCPVLVMSAVGGRSMARELGAADVIAKPFDVDEVLTKVDALPAQRA